MKLSGKVRRGSYAGQQYEVVAKGMFPGWSIVELTDANNRGALREVRDRDLEAESWREKITSGITAALGMLS